jgi:hypothetical protein
MREQGRKLIVVDPRRSETARHADLHLQLIPGEDATLYAGILAVLFRKEWIDRAFCERFVTNLEVLESAVASYTPEYVAGRTGLTVEEIEEAARLMGTARRAFASCSTGTTMGPDSNLADFLLESPTTCRRRSALARASESRRVDVQVDEFAGVCLAEFDRHGFIPWRRRAMCRNVVTSTPRLCRGLVVDTLACHLPVEAEARAGRPNSRPTASECGQ